MRDARSLDCSSHGRKVSQAGVPPMHLACHTKAAAKTGQCRLLIHIFWGLRGVTLFCALFMSGALAMSWKVKPL